MAAEPNQPAPDRDRRLRPTGRQELIIAAVLGAGIGWLLVRVASALDVTAPRVPWTAPVAMVLLAAFVALLARSTHQRIQVRRERVEPERAVTFLILGKASALAGALISGGYLAYALSFVARFDADTPRERVIRSAVAVVGSVGLSLAGLWLERACRVPDDDQDEDEDAASGDTPTA